MATFWAIFLGLLGFSLVVGATQYWLRPRETPLPLSAIVGSTSTSLPATKEIVWDVSLQTWTSTLPPQPSSAPPPPVTPTFTPEIVPASAVQVLDSYFRNINTATQPDDILNSWNLMTTNMQNNPNDNGQFTHFRDWWWQWHLIYRAYDCGPYSVIVYYRLAPRSQPASPSANEYYERYTLVQENGQLKINEGHLTNGLDTECTLVIDSP